MASRKKTIHVNQHKIQVNKSRKIGSHEPVLTVKTYNSNDYGYEVEILGPSNLVYRPNKPLSCGARVWLETKSVVKLDGKIID